MKVVLDTNVLLISIPFGSPYYPIFDAFLSGKINLCVSTDILDEYAEILESKYALRPNVAKNVMAVLENSPDVIMVNKYFHWNLIHTDPDDNKFVDCAIAANAVYIVTNDRHFNVLNDVPFPKVQVITAEAFLVII